MMQLKMKNPESYQIEILPRQDILSYKVTGYVRTEHDFHQFIHDVNEIIKQSIQKKVLADIRNLEGFRPDIFGAIRVVEEGFSRELWGRRIAIIEREENIGNMKQRETVAWNRGYSLKYFTSAKEAEAWLQ